MQHVTRLCLAALPASAVLVLTTGTASADERGADHAPAIDATSPPPIAKEAVTEPATKKTAVDAPPGYEDAPDVGGQTKPPKPVRDWSRMGEFGKAAAILDRPVDANVRNAETRYRQQFQRLVKVEASFLLRVCELDEKQQRKIREVSGLCAKIAARRYAMSQYGQHRVNAAVIRAGIRVPAVGQVEQNLASSLTQARSDPRGMTRRLVRAAIDDLLSAAQKKRYAEEDKKRTDHLKRTTVMTFVGHVDRHLALTSRQREQLAESLTKAWEPSWTRMLRYLLNDDYKYMPKITERHVVRLLTESQRAVWDSITKSSGSSYGSYSFGYTPEVVEDKFGGKSAIKIENNRPGPVPVIRR